MIRAAELNDLEDIAEFDIFAGGRRREIAERRMFVWESERRVVGYVTLAGYLFLGHPFVQFLCVQKGHRRPGIASALMNEVERQHQGTRLFISTESTNSAMLSLLASRGYSRSGALSGVNKDGCEEVFFFRDIEPSQAGPPE